MIRRAIAANLAVFFFLFSITSPARALAPIAVIGPVAVIAADGASYALGALAGAVGLAGLYALVEDSEGNAARIPLSDSPEAEPPAPAASATAPGSTSTSTVYTGNVGCPAGNWNGNLETACAQYAAGNNACWGTNGWSYTSRIYNGVCQQLATQVVDGVAYPMTWQNVSLGPGNTTSVTTCPSGYVVSGSSCVLSNPREATPDKKCDAALANGAYAYAADMDCPGAGTSIDHSKAVPVIRNNGKEITIAGQDSMGRPVVVELIRSADNTQTQIKQSTQIGPNVKTETATLSGPGQVTNVSTQTAPGQITIPQSSPATSSSPGTSTDTPKVTTDPTKDPVLQFPDDYAREPTTQAIKTGIDTLHKDLTDKENVADPTIPGSTEFTDSFFKETFNPLKGWQLPAHSSACPTGSFDMFGSTQVIDAHCTLIGNQAGVLQTAMAVVWSLLALFIVLRA